MSYMLPIFTAPSSEQPDSQEILLRSFEGGNKVMQTRELLENIVFMMSAMDVLRCVESKSSRGAQFAAFQGFFDVGEHFLEDDSPWTGGTRHFGT